MTSEHHSIKKITSKKRWDEIYRKQIATSIDRTLPTIAKIFKEYNVKKVLDLACGSGRHVLYMAKLGFEVYGIDISEEGIKAAKSLLYNNNLYAELTVGSIYERLPYEDNFFDGIVCIRSLNHGTIEDIRKLIKEMGRVLKPRGSIYATVRKRVAKGKRLPFKEIAPRTYIPLEGKEKGVVHYLVNESILRKEFHDFKIHKLWIEYGPGDWEAYYCLLGELKVKGDDNEN